MLTSRAEEEKARREPAMKAERAANILNMFYISVKEGDVVDMNFWV
jgi:hypothetical protein